MMLSWLLDAFFPPTCVGCGVEGAWFCQQCTNFFTLRHVCFACRRPSPSGRFCFQCRGERACAGIVAMASYADSRVRAAVHALKFEHARVLAPLLARVLARGIHECEGGKVAAVLVPVPTSAYRIRQRGYNQAALLAAHVAKELQLPMRNSVQRRGWALSQTSLAHADRSENIRGAFQITDPRPIVGQCVLLVDDVATTGSTLEEVARVCRDAGAREIWGCVLAHG